MSGHYDDHLVSSLRAEVESLRILRERDQQKLLEQEKSWSYICDGYIRHNDWLVSDLNNIENEGIWAATKRYLRALWRNLP